jgi:hypothetical protein
MSIEKKRNLSLLLAIILTIVTTTVGTFLFSINNDPRKNDPDLLGIPKSIVNKPNPMSVDYYKEKMFDCVDKYGVLQQLDRDKFLNKEISPASNCVLKVFFEASDRLDIRTIVNATAVVVEQNPSLYLVCHDLSHRAAKRAYIVSGENAKMLLSQVPFRTCDDGFVHGIFDAVAHLYGADGKEFSDVMDSCVELGMSPDGKKIGTFSYSTCGDGAGHVLYNQANQNLDKAIELCDGLQQKEIRRWCVMGAMMETYKKYFATWNQAQIDEVITSITKLCRNWPENLKDNEGTFEGCYSAGGYLFNNMAITRSVQILDSMVDNVSDLISNNKVNMPENVKEPYRGRIIAEYDNVKSRCELFPEKYHRDCFYIVHSIIAIQLRKDKDLYDSICKRVLTKEFVANCIETRLWGMGAY